jgi:tRNA:m4X modification enzyme
VALCCHHRCEWADFCGRSWFESELGVGARGFAALKRASSWCTGYWRGGDGDGAERPRGGWGRPGASGAISEAERARRAEIGRRCKRIIDLGRIFFLRESLGMQCELVRYASSAVTPENVLLLAWPAPAAGAVARPAQSLPLGREAAAEAIEPGSNAPGSKKPGACDGSDAADPKETK